MYRRGAYRKKNLASMCVAVVAQFAEQCGKQLLHLPPSVRCQIVAELAARGRLSAQLAEWLLHAGTTSLRLDACPVSDSTLRSVGVCRALSVLALPQAPVSEGALLDTLPLLPALRCLELRGVLGVTDRVVVCVALHCPLLSVLDLDGCPGVGDAGVCSLARLCHLSSLGVRASAVGDEGVLALVRGRPGDTLYELHLDGCGAVTDASIKYAAIHCTHLSTLTFQECSVTEAVTEAMDMLRQRCGVLQLSWTVY